MSAPESILQKAAVQFLEIALKPYRGVVFVIPNARHSRRIAGFKPGAPDLAVIVRGKFYGIELKTPDGTISVDQQRMGTALTEAGALVYIARSLDEVGAAFRSIAGEPGNSLSTTGRRDAAA